MLKSSLLEMEQHAYHDALTGLSNRRLFVDSLKDRVARCQRYGDNSALLFLDVDNLKTVNDQHGHAAGDMLLVQMGKILKNHTRTSDVVARIGGDEFGVMLDNLDGDQVIEKIDFLMRKFEAVDCTYEGISLPFSAAIGFCFVGPKDTVEDLMSRADAAMYRAKESAE
ncbi:MAG: GGDEF domain-containing protein [Parasphingorhabdus sp.]|uniref:GGDEF domain-containing protein n=1 Tax=Parasphingorhabdus sp. TaxID=2709688 RepID=UPI0032657491